MWAFTCEPRPSTKRPRDAFWRSHAVWARIIGLRANATASDTNGSWRVTADQIAPNPISSARRA